MNEKSRTKNTKKNLLNGIINVFITILLSFATRTIFVKLLSTEYLGVNGLYSNILNILTLTELGLSNVALFSLYKPLVEKDEEKVSQLVHFFDKLFYVIFLIILGMGLLLIPFLRFIVNSNLELKELIIYYVLYLLSTSISYLGISKQILINADQRVYIIKNASTCFNILQNVLQIASLIYFKNYYTYLTVQCICTIFINIYLINKANKLYPFLKKPQRPIEKSEKNDIFKRTKDLFMYKISVIIVNCTDNIFISTLLGTSIVGYYSNYAMVITVFSTLMNTIINAISSSIGNLNAKSSKEKKIDIFYNLLFIMQWITGFFSMGMIIMFNDFINLWIGAEYTISILSVIIIVMNFYIQNIINPVWMYRESLGLFKEVKGLMFITAILNIIFSYVFGKLLGLAGIFLATLVSRLLTTVWYEPIILLKKTLDVDVKKYYLTQLKYILLFSVVTIGIYFIAQNIVVNNLIIFALKGIIITLSYNVIYLVIFYRNNNFKIILNKILNKE